MDHRAQQRLRLAGLVALLVAGALWPLAMASGYYHGIGTLACIWIILALGMNILMGHAGLVQAGFAALFGIGAYGVALLQLNLGMSFWLSMPLSAALAAVVAVGIGLPALRVSGLYFVLITLAFNGVFTLTVLNTPSVTGGPNGLYGLARPELFGITLATPRQLYGLAYVALLMAAFVFWRVSNSRLGRAWNYLREDEVAGRALGMNPVRVRAQAALIGGLFAGVAGALFAVRQTAVHPDSFTYVQSFLVIFIISLGGLRSIRGAVVGTLAIVVLPELLRPLADVRYAVFSAALILMMLYRPKGLLPARERRSYDHVLAEHPALQPSPPSSEIASETSAHARS